MGSYFSWDVVEQWPQSFRYCYSSTAVILRGRWITQPWVTSRPRRSFLEITAGLGHVCDFFLAIHATSNILFLITNSVLVHSQHGHLSTASTHCQPQGDPTRLTLIMVGHAQFFFRFLFPSKLNHSVMIYSCSNIFQKTLCCNHFTNFFMFAAIEYRQAAPSGYWPH